MASLYTPELEDEICKRLSAGESLLQICKTEGFPAESTVRSWVVDDSPPGFAAKYARARDLGLDHIAEQIIEIVDTEPDPNIARVRIDARKWFLSKIASKKYGDKSQLEHTGEIAVKRVVVDV